MLFLVQNANTTDMTPFFATFYLSVDSFVDIFVDIVADISLIPLNKGIMKAFLSILQHNN